MLINVSNNGYKKDTCMDSAVLHYISERPLGGVPQDYLDIHDLDDDELESLMDLTSPHPAL